MTPIYRFLALCRNRPFLVTLTCPHEPRTILHGVMVLLIQVTMQCTHTWPLYDALYIVAICLTQTTL
jgi:hypothetical protein